MRADPKPLRRVRLRAFVVLLFTFVAGALVGMASERALSADEPARVERSGGAHGPGGQDRRAALADRLDLTPGQRASLDSIVAEDREKAGAILREMRPRLRARYDSTTTAIRAILTPEQQAEFDRYRQERRDRVRLRIKRSNHGRDDEA